MTIREKYGDLVGRLHRLRQRGKAYRLLEGVALWACVSGLSILSVVSAEAIFGRKQAGGEDRRIARLATENQRMKNVVAEITAENLDLKKTLSD